MMHPKLKELEEAARAATKGTWVHDRNGFIGPFKDDEWKEAVACIANMKDVDLSEQDQFNAQFIARANPDTVLKLVEVIGFLEQALNARSRTDQLKYLAAYEDTLNRIGER
jgi:hypothetical protein